MGMFDDIYWPDGRRTQVKCFDRLLRCFSQGDEVQLDPPARYGEAMPYVVPPVSFQIMVGDGSFITVVQGALHSWDEVRDPDLLLVDIFGWPWQGYSHQAAPRIE